MKLGQPGLRTDPLAVWRIRDDQASLARRPGYLAERTLFHVQPVCDAGLACVCDGHPHRFGVDISTQDAALGRARGTPGQGFCAQARPERRIVSMPPQEPEVFAIES